MGIEEQQFAGIYLSRTEKQKEATKLYAEFDLREVFKDNHNTENLYSLSFCPHPRPRILAVTASNHLSVFDTAYHEQWLALQLKFVKDGASSTKERVSAAQEHEETEILSFSWLNCWPFRALAGTRGGEIKRFNLQRDTRELKPFAEKHAQPVTTIAGFLKGQYAVTLSKGNGEVRVWDCGNPESCLHRELINDAVWATQSADELSVLIGCRHSLKIVNIVNDAGGLTAQIRTALISNQGKNFSLQICKSLSSDEVVIVSGRKSVSVWNLKSKARVANWQCVEKVNSPESFDVCRTTGLCVLGSYGAIEIRDIYSGLLHKRIEHHRISRKISLTHVGISQDGLCIVAGSGQKIYKFSQKYKENSRCEFCEL